MTDLRSFDRTFQKRIPDVTFDTPTVVTTNRIDAHGVVTASRYQTFVDICKKKKKHTNFATSFNYNLYRCGMLVNIVVRTDALDVRISFESRRTVTLD